MGDRAPNVVRRRTRSRHRQLVQARQRRIDGGMVLLHYGLAAPAIGPGDGVLDFLQGVLARQDAGNREETRLHDRVDAGPQAAFAGHAIRVNREQTQPPLDHDVLHFAGQLVPHTIGFVRRIEQHHASRLGGRQNVEPVQEAELVACDDRGA
jgi:hypothetical protein